MASAHFSLNQSLVKARGALLRQANAEMDSKDANSHFVLHVHRKSLNRLFLQSIYEKNGHYTAHRAVVRSVSSY